MDENPAASKDELLEMFKSKIECGGNPFLIEIVSEMAETFWNEIEAERQMEAERRRKELTVVAGSAKPQPKKGK